MKDHSHYKPRFDRWTEEDDARLLRLRDVEMFSWAVIVAAFPQRSLEAIKLRYYRQLGHRNAIACGLSRKSGRPKKGAVQVVSPPLAPAAPTPSRAVLAPLPMPQIQNMIGGRPVSTATLLAAAELRARIEILGLTGGVFGDPPPGRSALDARGGK